MCVRVHVCGYLVRAISLLPLMWVPGIESDHLAWQESPMPTKSSHKPIINNFKGIHA